MVKHLLRTFAVLSSIGLALPSLMAQEPIHPELQSSEATASPSEITNGFVHIQLEKPSVPRELSLTLRRAIELALERNPLLTVEQIRLEQAREKIEEEKGFYDPLFNIQTSTGRRENVVASRFYPAGFYVDKEWAGGVGIEARTYTGGRFTLGLDYKRLASTSNTQTLSPQYSANLAFSLSHALLRDFGVDVNTTRIRVAERGEAIAEHSLAQRVAQLIQQVEEAYWGLIFTRQDLELRHKSLLVAEQLLRRSEELFRADRVAAVNVLEARAGVATREEALILAESEMRKFEDRLKLLLHVDLSGVSVTPLDQPAEDLVLYDMGLSLERALTHRAEIQALHEELEQRAIEQKFATNQTLPRLDFTAQYGMAGLSGRPNQTCIDPTPAGIDFFSGRCTPVGTNVGNSVFAGQTRPGDAVDRFFRSPFDYWFVELKLQIPLWNRTATARLSEANLRLAETGTRLRALHDQIVAETRIAIRDTLAARKRMEASRETVRFVEDQLEGTKRKFEAGLSTTYDLLLVLDDLDKAKANEGKALIDYNIGQSKVRYAEGTILDKYNIEFKKPPRYRFH